jgi:hypothetical protein
MQVYRLVGQTEEGIMAQVYSIFQNISAFRSNGPSQLLQPVLLPLYFENEIP